MTQYKQPKFVSVDKHLLERWSVMLDKIIQDLQPFVEGAHKTMGFTHLYGKERYYTRTHFDNEWKVQGHRPDCNRKLIDPKAAFAVIIITNNFLKALVKENEDKTEIIVSREEIRPIKAVMVTLRGRAWAHTKTPGGPVFKHQLFRHHCENLVDSICSLNKEMVRFFGGMKGLYPKDIFMKGSIDMIYAYAGKIRAHLPETATTPPDTNHVEATSNGKIGGLNGGAKPLPLGSILETAPDVPSIWDVRSNRTNAEKPKLAERFRSAKRELKPEKIPEVISTENGVPKEQTFGFLDQVESKRERRRKSKPEGLPSRR